MLPQLKKLGLTDTEAKVYVSALELGEATTTRIAQKAKLKRTTVYSAILVLRELGLLTRAKRGKRFVYFAEDPGVVVRLAEERLKVAKSVLPSLLGIANLIDKKPKVLFYEGLEGVKNLYRKTLSYPNIPMYSWVPTITLHGDALKWYDDDYRPKRIGNKIFFYAIAADSEYARKYQTGDEKGFKKTIIDSSGDFEVEGSILLFGDRSVAVYSWEDMIGVVIESEKMYKTLKGVFRAHWRSLGGGEMGGRV